MKDIGCEINRRSLPNKVRSRAYNWILFMDFIQNVYRCINYKRRARKERREKIDHLPPAPGAGPAFLSFHPEL